MLKIKSRIAAAATVAAASLSIIAAAAPGSASVSGDVSTNWAGYFSVSRSPIVAATVDFTVPKVSCAQSRGAPDKKDKGPAYQGLMWVGIGGIDGQYGANSGPLEQDGIAAYCTSLHATPVYEPFWEVVPGKPSPVPFTDSARVDPGAQIIAAVYAPSVSPVQGQWWFYVTSYYDGRLSTWSAHYASSATGTDYTAETITEKNAPGLVYLGKITYNCADYFTNNVGSTYSIAANRVTSVTNLRQRAPIVVAGNAYEAPKVCGDNRKNSFTTQYATNWLR